MSPWIHRVAKTLALCASMTLAGCAAVETSIAKRDLDVQTKVSTPIFVEPVSPHLRSVYVEFRSTVMEFDRAAMDAAVRETFANNANGYTITDDPAKAYYQLSVFVLNLERTDPTAAERALTQGYRGDQAAGVVAGAAIGGRTTGNYGGAAAGGILGAMAATAGNAFVKDVTYMLVADVQIRETAANGALVRKDSQIGTQISDAGTSTQRVSEVSKFKTYRTRVVTTANKANLELEEAQQEMFDRTAYAISGFF